MALTPKQEKFCQEVAKGSTYSDAYRCAYDAENSSDTTINNKAYQLMTKGDIRARVSKLKEAVQKDHVLTVESQLEELRELKELSKKEKRYNDAINAVKEQNKLLGFYELDNKQKTPIVKPPKIVFTKASDEV